MYLMQSHQQHSKMNKSLLLSPKKKVLAQRQQLVKRRVAGTLMLISVTLTKKLKKMMGPERS
jgi:hypothetical protein